MASKYSDSDVARLAGQDYKSLTGYEKRLVRGYNRGLSRSESRGHARTQKGEVPVSKRSESPKLQKGTGKVAPVTPTTPIRKPTLSKSGKSGRKNLGGHVSKQYDQQGNVRRTRVNARTTESLGKQLFRTSDDKGVIIHLIGKDGNVVKAVGQGKKHTANAGDLKKRIADNLAGGSSLSDAIFDAIGESFSFYDEQGNYVADISSMDFTNIIMYIEPV